MTDCGAPRTVETVLELVIDTDGLKTVLETLELFSAFRIDSFERTEDDAELVMVVTVVGNTTLSCDVISLLDRRLLTREVIKSIGDLDELICGDCNKTKLDPFVAV